jgi:hypothetical protein
VSKETRLFYDQFPNPPEINPCHFKFDKDLPKYDEAEAAWYALTDAQDEWSDKAVKGHVQESDVLRWRAVYDKFRDIINRGIKDEYKEYYLGG